MHTYWAADPNSVYPKDAWMQVCVRQGIKYAIIAYFIVL